MSAAILLSIIGAVFWVHCMKTRSMMTAGLGVLFLFAAFWSWIGHIVG